MTNDIMDWYNVDLLEKKKLRREASDNFLKDTLTIPGLREKVLGNEADALTEFKARYLAVAGVSTPPDVRVICIKPDLTSRSNLVVFCLSPIAGETPHVPVRPIWQDGWLAAWPPY